MGHQTQVKGLLAKDSLLACINTMKDNQGVGVDEEDERAFELAYLRAYEILTGSPLGVVGEAEGRDEE